MSKPLAPAATEYYCPACGRYIHKRLEDGQHITCDQCHSQWHVFVDDTTGRAAFQAMGLPPEVDPLHLPPGSTRAAVALILAGTAWVMMLMDNPVPEWLGGLVIAVVVFYFASRKRKPAPTLLEPVAQHQQKHPLFLPGGAVRMMLSTGFIGVTALLLLLHGTIDTHHLQFLLLIAGLIVGNVFAGYFEKIKGTRLHRFVTHGLALSVVLLATSLAIVAATGMDDRLGPTWLSLLCAAVMFYFGKRS